MNSVKNIAVKVTGLLVIILNLGCRIIQDKPEAEINRHNIILKNRAIEAIWTLKEGSIHLLEVHNKYDDTRVNLAGNTLYALETAQGILLSNKDFKLQGELSILTLEPSDSLPGKSHGFTGKEISGLFLSGDENIAINWKAELREGSNYIRQSISIESIKEAIEIKSVSFFDGTLDGAFYAGSVLGSPIIYKNFFFGMEHPISHSKALFQKTIGSISNEKMDLTGIIKEAGSYVAIIEHGGGSHDFNVNAISLLKDGKVVSEQRHVLNGYNGSNLYHLDLETHSDNSQYYIELDLTNKKNASGILHLYKKTDNLLNFYVLREDVLLPGKSITEWAVIGVSPEDQLRRSFLQYIERERARPYKQFLHYNCWWDITDDGASSFTSEQLIERMRAWNEKFIKPYDVKLDAFVFDDGWDNLDSLWYFDPVKFPNGFAEQALLCREFNSGIGVWMSPFGGYLENQKRRILSAKREGLEINDKGLSLSGENYFKRFYERSADMLLNYNVAYFKYDGFGGSDPVYLPDMEAGTRLISSLRKINPEVFINITVGSWPSPFWLKYADCTWRGSGDLHNAGQGNTSQKFMTYRDGTLHNNIKNRAPFYPLNSIMVAGIAYANLGHPAKFITEDKEDFKDMVHSFFGAGSCLQELYISHDKMKADFWPILAEAAKWSGENEDVFVDTHWIGGSPINLEVYGFASWKPGKGIIMLRNPTDRELEYHLDLKRDLELPEEHSGIFILKSPWEEDCDLPVIIVNSHIAQKIKLHPFEVKILEAKQEHDLK